MLEHVSTEIIINSRDFQVLLKGQRLQSVVSSHLPEERFSDIDQPNLPSKKLQRKSHYTRP